MEVISLIIGTALSMIFIAFMKKGQKYNYMTELLSGDDFPFPSIYCVGLAMQDVAIFRAPEKLAAYIRNNAKLMYTQKYAEYYYRIVWAQALSMGMLCCAVLMLLAGMIPDMTLILFLMALITAVLPGYVFINNLAEKISTRRDESARAFPDAISKLALIVNSGVIMHEAWALVAYGNTGVFYELMQQSCKEMENGKSDVDAILSFGYQTDSDEIKKFTSMLAQSIERGGGELPFFLNNQSRELWAHHRQAMLQKGEQAASALLMPIALMFVGVMLLVIVAALQSLSI